MTTFWSLFSNISIYVTHHIICNFLAKFTAIFWSNQFFLQVRDGSKTQCIFDIIGIFFPHLVHRPDDHRARFRNDFHKFFCNRRRLFIGRLIWWLKTGKFCKHVHFWKMQIFVGAKWYMSFGHRIQNVREFEENSLQFTHKILKSRH